MIEIDSFTGHYRWLSNFWLVRIDFEGEVYNSVEHAYQAAKTLSTEQRFPLTDRSSSIISKRPGLAKKHGRCLTVRNDWEDIKVDIMRSLLLRKFVTGSDLANLLIGTGDVQLTEGNTWGDTFWGKCGGIGHNYLGFLLMEIRSELRSS